ncbi:L,D-transpeptidase [Salmonella enterica subsp. enterica serovar Enteritidis]|nr:L,D-transpeptidase [Salmonella enterica subsp. enterica serovar Enteritidis]EFG8199987.1 L,D-transpeptidase [Escherichia coli]
MGRRAFLVGASALTLAGCSAIASPPPIVSAPPSPAPKPKAGVASRRETPPMYYAMPEERFPIPEVDVSKVDPKWWRAEVDYPTSEKVGTVIVDTPNRYLYHVRAGGKAIRYGVGVGRAGFEWQGRGHIAYKREWPRWNPPNEMVARQPSLEPVSIANGGMAPGLKNPLGSRALYIHEGNRDTIYRIHGSPEHSTIGRAVSSGCIRMINQDVIHLAANVRDGSTIVVIPDPKMSKVTS